MTAALAALLALHGGDGRLELTYFWSAILIVLLPTIVFGTIGVLVFRGYLRRDRRDEGGDQPSSPALDR